MALKEKIMAIFVGAIVSVMFLFVFFLYYYLFLTSNMIGIGSVFGMNMNNPWTVNILFFGLLGMILFVFPPLSASIFLDNRKPSSTDADYFTIGSVSTAMSSLILLLIMTAISSVGGVTPLMVGKSILVCPMIFIFWCALSGLIGPITMRLKRVFMKMFKKS